VRLGVALSEFERVRRVRQRPELLQREAALSCLRHSHTLVRAQNASSRVLVTPQQDVGCAAEPSGCGGCGPRALGWLTGAAWVELRTSLVAPSLLLVSVSHLKNRTCRPAAAGLAVVVLDRFFWFLDWRATKQTHFEKTSHEREATN